MSDFASDHPDLLALPANQRHVVDADRFGGLTALEARAHALGPDRRMILTHSPTLHQRQRIGFAQTLGKVTGQLDELAATLRRGKTRRSRQTVQAQIERICKPRWVSRILRTELSGDTPAEFRLIWHIDSAAQDALAEEIFGKRVLVTDHEHWPTADVVAAYRCQAEVESGFRQLKDPHVVSLSPMYHWTDQKIRVHLLTCVLALIVAHLMRRQAAQAGFRLSVRELLTHRYLSSRAARPHPDPQPGTPRARPARVRVVLQRAQATPRIARRSSAPPAAPTDHRIGPTGLP